MVIVPCRYDDAQDGFLDCLAGLRWPYGAEHIRDFASPLVLAWMNCKHVRVDFRRLFGLDRPA